MADTGAKLVNADDIATRLIEALGKVDDRKPVEELKRLPVWLRVPQKIGEAVVEMGTGAVGSGGFRR